MPGITAALTGESAGPTDAPWMARDTFPAPPDPQTYGYRKHKHICPCTREELERQIAQDRSETIEQVWEPGAERLLVPEELPWLFPALLERERAHINQQRLFSKAMLIWIGTCWIISVLTGASVPVGAVLLVLGMWMIQFVEHLARLLRLRTATPALFTARVPEARYSVWRAQRGVHWTTLLVVCVTAVALVQALVGVFGQVVFSELGKLFQPAVRSGELQLLNAPLLHDNVLHISFSTMSLLVLGSILETTFHRAFVPLVFVLSALAANVTGLVLLGRAPVGASGGVLGLLGCLIVFARHRRDRFPSTRRRDMLNSAICTAAAALSGIPLIDNAAHAGGLLVGALLGALLVRGRRLDMPTVISGALVWAGYLAGGVVLLSTALCLYLLVWPGS